MRLLKFLLLCVFVQLNAFCSDVNPQGDGRTSSSIVIDVLRGNEVIPYLQKLAELRITFYRSYPYLYEGTLTEEENYLSMYANSENSILVVAKKGEEVVGAVAGISLLETHAMHKKLWDQQEVLAENIFYLGELVLLQDYRRSDLQERLYQQLEQAVQGLKKYDSIIVCEIERDPKDSKKIENASSSEILWDNRGFVRQPELNTHFLWKDIDDLEETDHFMVYWIKALSCQILNFSSYLGVGFYV